jgi:putative ABC transport system permease protein
MIDLDHFHEILQTMRRNRLRTFLTACGIFWGVFMLVIMLGFGRGLAKGAGAELAFHATNTLYVSGALTTKAFAGRQVGQKVQVTLDDLEAVKQVSGVEIALGRSQRFGASASRGEKSIVTVLSGNYPELGQTEASVLTLGRFINEVDMAEHRKVAVIGTQVRDVLFEPTEDPIGRPIKVANTLFQVVGVLDASSAPSYMREYMNSRIFVPHPVFAHVTGMRDRVGDFLILVAPTRPAAEVEREISDLLKLRHKVAPDDDRAIRTFSREKGFKKLADLFQAIGAVTWVVGILTLLAGAIGVSNIMMIAVAERSREIAIRKAVGATPLSIIAQVVAESTLLTALAGYLGLLAGVGVIEGVARFMAAHPATGTAPSFFASPELDFGRAILAATLLTVIGGLAGLAPAWAAAGVRPVEALAHE